MEPLSNEIFTAEDLFFHGMLRKVRLPVPNPLLPKLTVNIGPGEKDIQGATRLELPDWVAGTPMPYEDESVGVFYAYHFLEHLGAEELWHTLYEMDRCLHKDGLVYICVPYGTCHMAVQDPTHKTFFNEDSWDHLLANPFYSETLANPSGDQTTSLVTEANFIMGVKGENLALLTVLRKAF